MDTPHVQANPSHTIVPGSRRRMMPGSKLMGHCNPDEQVQLTLTLRRKAPLPPLEGRLAVPITRKEAAANYGASDADIANVKAVMEANKVKVLGANQATRCIKVEGPIKVLEDVFQVKLFQFTHAGRNFRGRTGVVHIPSALDGVVTAVYGLDNRPVIRRRRRGLAQAGTAPRAAGGAAPAGFTPANLADAYDFPPGDGTGEVIGILEFGGGFFPDDLRLFCDTVGVPVPTVKPVSVDNTPTDTLDDVAGEVMLDVEVVAGACPGATQVVYFGSERFDERAWIDTLGAAIHDQDN
jgi:kumamolisin